MDEKFKIEQVSEWTGLSRRTIRYCVQKGLIEPPAGRGRRGHYNMSHLEMLRRIRGLRDKGLSFAKIRENLKSRITKEWIRRELDPGVEVNISSDRYKKGEVKIDVMADTGVYIIRIEPKKSRVKKGT